MGQIAAYVVLSLRVVYGAALLAAPGRVTKTWLGPTSGEPPAAVPLRGLGAREIVIHGAALAVAARGGALRPWLAMSIAGDLADIVSTVAGRHGLPERSPAATAVVAGSSAALSAAVAAAVDR